MSFPRHYCVVAQLPLRSHFFFSRSGSVTQTRHAQPPVQFINRGHSELACDLVVGSKVAHLVLLRMLFKFMANQSIPAHWHPDPDDVDSKIVPSAGLSLLVAQVMLEGPERSTNIAH